MSYTPNPTDPTNPLDSTDASTAAAEFRALKAYVAGLVLGTAGFKPTVRQTVMAAAILATTGAPNFLQAGTGLALNVNTNGGANPVVMTSAQGASGNGPVDVVGQITADAVGVLTFPANNRSFVSYDILTNTTGTYGQTLARPSYATVYPQTRQSLVHLNGVNNAVTLTDDFGATWAMVGGAKLTNSYLPLATSTTSLGGAGTTNALNGTADYAKSASFTSLGPDGWTLRCKTKPLNALPGGGSSFAIISAVNNSNNGANLYIANVAGTIRFAYTLSGDGATNNISGLVQGTTLPVLGTAYDLALTFDAVAGVYRLYVNGSQEQTTASASKICSINQICLGSNNGLAGSFYQGYIGEFEFLPYCAYPNGTAFVPPTVASTVNTAGYAADWFSINEMKMYSPSAPSAVAGVNPTLTQKTRIYLGEATTTGAGFAANNPISYALNGQAESIYTNTLPGGGSLTSFSHNLGVSPLIFDFLIENIVAEVDFVPGQVFTHHDTYGSDGSNVVPQRINVDPLNMSLRSVSATPWACINAAGNNTAMTVGKYKWKFIAKRGWGGA